MTNVVVQTNTQILTVEQVDCLQASSKIRRWAARVSAAFSVKALTVERAYFFDTRLGYVMTNVEGTLDGRPLHGLAFLRGDGVAVLIVLTDPSGQRWVAIVGQPRVVIGSPHFLEIPAGMTDEADPIEQALAEVREEIGLNLEASELTEISRYYPSVGACDELITVYCAQRTVPHDVITQLHGRQTGVEGEAIRVQMVRLEDFPALVARDGKSLMAYYAYMAHLGRTATCVV